MASATIECRSKLPVPEATELAARAGVALPEFRLLEGTDGAGGVRLRRGWGATNPQEVAVSIVEDGDGSRLEWTVSLKTVRDPFKLAETTAERLLASFQEHESAAAEGRSPAAQGRDVRSWLVAGGVAGGAVALLIAYELLFQG